MFVRCSNSSNNNLRQALKYTQIKTDYSERKQYYKTIQALRCQYDISEARWRFSTMLRQ